MRPANIVTTAKLDLSRIDHGFTRADLEFSDLDHAGVSYTAHVFLNNPSATDATPHDEVNGYTGSFSIFGHGGCFGSEGHCHVPQRRAFDPRGDHPLTKARKVVVCTDAIRQAVQSGQDMTVTVVPLVTGTTVKTEELHDIVRFTKVRLVTYR